VSDLLERLLPPDVPVDRRSRQQAGKAFTARERPALRHDAGSGVEVRIYKVDGNRDHGHIILFVDAEHVFASLSEVRNTDWDALAQRGTLKENVARQARRIRSYLRGTVTLVGEDEQTFVRLAHVDRHASMVFRRSPAPSVRRQVEEAFVEHALGVIWLDRPPPNADEFPTWEQILDGC
jgi:hypothetical protein